MKLDALILDIRTNPAKRKICIDFDRKDEDKVLKMLEKAGFKLDIRKYGY